MASKIKIQDGFWGNDNAKAFITIIEGDKMKYKNLISLDYPDISFDTFSFDIELGEFDPTNKEMKEATKADNYNVCFTWQNMKFQGVANPEGDKIHLWGMMKKVEYLYKMTNEQIQAMKDARDHVDAPRYSTTLTRQQLYNFLYLILFYSFL